MAMMRENSAARQQAILEALRAARKETVDPRQEDGLIPGMTREQSANLLEQIGYAAPIAGGVLGTIGGGLIGAGVGAAGGALIGGPAAPATALGAAGTGLGLGAGLGGSIGTGVGQLAAMPLKGYSDELQSDVEEEELAEQEQKALILQLLAQRGRYA